MKKHVTINHTNSRDKWKLANFQVVAKEGGQQKSN
jgi:hypothetical protein